MGLGLRTSGRRVANRLLRRAGQRVARDLWREYALCLLFKRSRMGLPDLDLAVLLEGFDEQEARLGRLPKGEWSTPITDIVVLCKLVRAVRPMRVAELGSYRGYTALAMAQNLPAGATLLTVDLDPRHGEAYRDIDLGVDVERRVGSIARSLFRDEEIGRFDLVFLDADHALDAVRADTPVALDLVTPDGFVVWHDYANWGWFSGACGVPEALVDLHRSGLPVAHVLGTNMAIHSPAWCVDGAAADTYRDALDATEAGRAKPHWETGSVRAAV